MKKRTRTKNPNTNCLEGWRCPDCGSFGDFEIGVGVLCRMTDNGTEEYYGDTEYDRNSYAKCLDCGKAATVGYFQEK